MEPSRSSPSLPNRFDFAEAEPRIYQLWESRQCFHSDPDPTRAPFTIVIPPPNVTGALHLGHALNNTLQDILIRFRRMQGCNVLWMPGTDHAGIATQAVVERRLREEEGLTRHDLGREGLVARIWQWKEQYEARILGQLRQLGASCDWRRTRFTLDAMCARAVRRTFFNYFREGLIYRGKRLVNWDTFLQTAVSDDEVFHETIQGHFWHLRYPVLEPQPGEPTHVTIATTRPETMLGDTAVAVHPDPRSALAACRQELTAKLTQASPKERPALEAQLQDLQRREIELLPELERLRDMARAGRKVLLPLLNRPLPLVLDSWAKPEMGSGCVKITPAHDPNDYEVGQRLGLPMINILHPDGTLNAQAGPYAGRTILEARREVVRDMEQLGLLERVEEREIDLAHSDRSKTPIEPFLADQWFVRMEDLAQSAMDAVTQGQVRITPARYARGYLDWLAEKRDWPVSRQLWWGHQIPVWTFACATQEEYDRMWATVRALPQVKGSETQPVIHLRTESASGSPDSVFATIQACIADGHEDLEQTLEQMGFRRDPDVLDTWFSSALWPHSTLGWPDQTEELAYYYPTSVLITSRDIITLWVARMVLTSLSNTGKIPFHDVFIHPKILDGFGETMSKSKGNGVDPLDVIQKFGADALRFGLAFLTTDTQDVRMPVQFECPHCGALQDQTRENRELPRLKCDQCAQEFSTQWAATAEDRGLPRASVVSDRFELARNFGNKLWNAARFVLLGLEGYQPAPVDRASLTIEDRWVLSRLASVTEQVTRALERFKFSEAARAVYDFAWDEYCSFYIEMLKDRLRDPAARDPAQRMLAWSLDILLRLLHPVVPFITEEIWSLLGQRAPGRGLDSLTCPSEILMLASWPEGLAEFRDTVVESRFRVFQQTLGAVREVRSRQGIPPKQVVRFLVRCPSELAELLEPMQPYFASLARAEAVGFGPDVVAPTTCAETTLGELEILVDLAGCIDVQAEIDKNQKQLQRLLEQIAGKRAKLANEQFVSRAPREVVEREQRALQQLELEKAAAEAALIALRKE